MRAHAELIKRWADEPDMEIEVLSDKDKWEPVPSPHWNENALYREKPKTVKKVAKWLWVLQDDHHFVSQHYFATIEAARDFYLSKVICKIEQSKIEVEE
jgi:hypothetical protein